MLTFKGKHEKPIVGFSAGIARGGETLPVLVKGIATSEEGDSFYKLMDGVYRSFVFPLQRELIQAGRWPDALPNFIIRQYLDGEYELIVGGYGIQAEVLSKVSAEEGSPVYLSQIGDIRRVTVPELAISGRETVIYFLSHRWRHGIYLDFGCANSPDYKLNKADFEIDLAQLYLTVWFPIFGRNDSVTSRMEHCGWFPFIAMAGDAFDKLYAVYRDEAEPENKEWVAVDAFDAVKLRTMAEHWYTRQAIKSGREFFEKAIERFEQDDFLSCISILFPRIEGVLRQLYLPQAGQPNIERLLERLKNEVAGSIPNWSLFRYNEFLEYLREWFFKGFNLSTGQVDLSRHSTSHGVAPSAEYTKRNAVIGFLILDQISFYLRA